MRFGVVEILILGALCCVPLVVIIGVFGVIVLLNKRLSPSSWFRKILAVATGVIVDFGGSNLAAGIYMAILAFGKAANLAQQKLSAAEIEERLLSELNPSAFGLSIPAIVSGILLSILGGYIAGKIARQDEIVYGFATGIGVILISVVLILTGLSSLSQAPVWRFVLGLASTLGSTTLGGYLAFLQRKRQEASLIASIPESPQES